MFDINSDSNENTVGGFLYPERVGRISVNIFDFINTHQI